jgi:signal transduction histidine kinase
MLILLTAMAVLLPLLAALQYYWLGQVSEGASQRLQSALRASATGFRHDFNREFIRAYLNFQIDSFTPPANIERYHLDRFEHWNQAAPYPQLISDVFVVSYDEQGLPGLSHLNAKTRQFELAGWSGELLNLRERFERRDGSSHLNSSSQNSIESFAEEIPALIVPFPLVSTQKPQQSQDLPLPPGFTIIKLDLNYMQREFIPTLIKRHLLDDAHTEYNVAIVSLNHPERVIYSSRHPMVDFASSDVSTRVFGLEADEIRTFLSVEGTSSADGKQTAPRALRLINLRLLKRAADREAPQPRGVVADSATSSSEDDGRWQLLIKHQAGSLAAAVSSVRHRNLAISFGILLLLGAGIFMTAISTRRAERLARQQINFVAGVTHELRTPLAVICSAGDNLAHGIIDTPEKAAQYGEVICREGRRLTDMVEQVLEFAGAQSGGQRYEFRPTDVRAFIEGAVAACQAQIQERDFQLETLTAAGVPPIYGNGAALRRVMQNLISNAIKYDGDNRWARISAQTSPCEKGQKGTQGNEVQITIEDRGVGINSADIPHIFEPFYRGHQAIATQIPGSGVGLSLVKQIIEAHGGRIRVSSRPGTGSTFTLHLPLAVEAGTHDVTN